MTTALRALSGPTSSLIYATALLITGPEIALLYYTTGPDIVLF